eukprot:Tbor_TRINITY_DN3972_c0_g1::TRINITY_DN3972_c0_g1_i4::g.740::m.740
MKLSVTSSAVGDSILLCRHQFKSYCTATLKTKFDTAQPSPCYKVITPMKTLPSSCYHTLVSSLSLTASNISMARDDGIPASFVTDPSSVVTRGVYTGSEMMKGILKPTQMCLAPKKTKSNKSKSSPDKAPEASKKSNDKRLTKEVVKSKVKSNTLPPSAAVISESPPSNETSIKSSSVDSSCEATSSSLSSQMEVSDNIHSTSQFNDTLADPVEVHCAETMMESDSEACKPVIPVTGTSEATDLYEKPSSDVIDDPIRATLSSAGHDDTPLLSSVDSIESSTSTTTQTVDELIVEQEMLSPVTSNSNSNIMPYMEDNIRHQHPDKTFLGSIPKWMNKTNTEKRNNANNRNKYNKGDMYEKRPPYDTVKWQCSLCGVMNFSSNTQITSECRRCFAPKAEEDTTAPDTPTDEGTLSLGVCIDGGSAHTGKDPWENSSDVLAPQLPSTGDSQYGPRGESGGLLRRVPIPRVGGEGNHSFTKSNSNYHPKQRKESDEGSPSQNYKYSTPYAARSKPHQPDNEQGSDKEYQPGKLQYQKNQSQYQPRYQPQGQPQGMPPGQPQYQPRYQPQGQ